MDPVRIAADLVGIVGIVNIISDLLANTADLVELTRDVQTQIDLIKQFSSAERDLRRYNQDIRNFRHILDDLHTTLEGATPNLELALPELSLLHTTLRSSKSSFLRLDTALKQLARDKILLQCPPGRPPQWSLEAMEALGRIRGETDRLKVCWHTLQTIFSLRCDNPTMLPADPAKTETMTKQNNGGVVDVEIDDEVLVMPSNVIPTPMVGNMSSTDLKSSLTNDEDRCAFTDRTSSSKKVIHTRTRPPQYNCENEAILPVKRSDCDIPNHHQCPNQWLSAPQVKQDGQHADRQGKRFTSADTNDSKTWLQRGGMLSLLVFAIICSYLMMQYELPGSQTKHCALYNDALTSCHKTDEFHPPSTLNPTTIPLPILLALMTSTTLSLTFQHYVLTLENRDRDLIILVIVGTGVITGLATGQDGITILLRVAPWYAIAAFVLCGLVLPPIKGRRNARREAQSGWVGAEKKRQIGNDGEGWTGSNKMGARDDKISFVV